MLGHFSRVSVLFLLLLVLLLSILLLESSDATCNTAGRYTNQLFILEEENGDDSFSKLSFSRLNQFLLPSNTFRLVALVPFLCFVCVCVVFCFSIC